MRNLLSKGYDKGVIENILKQLLEERGGSLLDESYVRRKVLMYKEKGKSKNFVISHMGESKEDAIIIQPIIEEIYAQGDEESLLREYQKLQGKFETKKIIEKLLRKGFTYDDIKKFF